MGLRRWALRALVGLLVGSFRVRKRRAQQRQWEAKGEASIYLNIELSRGKAAEQRPAAEPQQQPLLTTTANATTEEWMPWPLSRHASSQRLVASRSASSASRSASSDSESGSISDTGSWLNLLDIDFDDTWRALSNIGTTIGTSLFVGNKTLAAGIASGLAHETPVRLARRGVQSTASRCFVQNRHAVIAVHIGRIDVYRLVLNRSEKASDRCKARLVQMLGAIPLLGIDRKVHEMLKRGLMRNIVSTIHLNLPQELAEQLGEDSGITVEVLAKSAEEQAGFFYQRMALAEEEDSFWGMIGNMQGEGEDDAEEEYFFG